MPHLTIAVNEYDIRAGVIGSCQFCPVARAARRALDCRRVTVDEDTIEYTHADYHRTDARADEWFIVPLPEEARAFVKRFDSRAGVRAFEFTVWID